MNEIVLKQYKVDYDFIIKNYLAPSLWNKEWTLFVYRDIFVTLQMDNININPRRIQFKLKIQDKNIIEIRYISYDLDNSNYNVLQKQIDNNIERLIDDLEMRYIRLEDEYTDIENHQEDEENMLRDIAEQFLDENDVTNDDIRDAYVESYIYNHRTISTLLSKYIYKRKYKVLSDLWIVYYKMRKDEFSIQRVMLNIDDEIDEGLQEEIDYILNVFEDENSDLYEQYRNEKEYELDSI